MVTLLANTEITAALARELVESHPLDAARLLERLEPLEAWEALRLFDETLRPAIIEGFNSDYAARVLLEAPTEDSTAIVKVLPSEVTADLLEYFPEEDRQKLLGELSDLHAEEIEELSDYEEDTAGSVMSPEFVSLREGATVADAMTRLRRMALIGQSVNYVYVLNDNSQLTGVLMMRDLVLSPSYKLLKDIMVKNVLRVYTSSPLSDVADMLMERRLLAAPVVDDNERLKGVVSATQLVSELQEEGFEDAQKMFGAGEDESASSTALFSIRKRLPWLGVNLLTAFLAGAVVGAFDHVLAQMTFLAAFLPIVAGQGGNSGAQALAVTLRSLALGEMDVRKPSRVIIKELLVGLSNGVLIGVLAGIVATIISGKVVLGVVILLAMIINLVMAAISGSMIPIVMQRLGQDPAQSSNILLTTVTDCVGYGVFLLLALLAQPWLM
jgi:magnesium transporter